jgi:hypothetical protein
MEDGSQAKQNVVRVACSKTAFTGRTCLTDQKSMKFVANEVQVR